LQIPVWILPGHPDRSVTLHFGYGRTSSGSVGNGTGFNVYSIRTSDAPWFGSAASLRRTGKRFPLATTQHHWLIDGRGLIHSGTLQQFREHPDHPEFMESEHGHGEPISLLPQWEYNGYKWGHGDRSECLHRLQCVHGRLPGREQCPRRRQAAGARGPRDALVARRLLLLGRRRSELRDVPSAYALHALRTRAVRTRMSRRGDEGLNEMIRGEVRQNVG
jgi:hypothetical protein